VIGQPRGGMGQSTGTTQGFNAAEMQSTLDSLLNVTQSLAAEGKTASSKSKEVDAALSELRSQRVELDRELDVTRRLN